MKFKPLFPLYNMGVINNWLGFYVILIMVSVAITIVFLAIRIITDRKGISADDFAITYPIEGKKRHWDWIVFLKTLLMVAILFGYMYIISALSQVTLNIELRGFWTFAKIITPQRMVKFFMYLPFFLLFYLINGGLSLFGWMRVKEAKNPVMTQLKWWLTACLIMVTGLLIVFAIQYLGFVFGYGPTFNRAPASADPDRIIWLFAPMMPLQLLSFIPMTMLILFGMTLFFRKTGRIYLGSILGALITTWFFVVGTVIGYGI
jgi:magnesium-transporting ATPase (P-type)